MVLPLIASSCGDCVAGGHLAGAWVALKAMGQDGYVDMARKLMDATNKMKEGVNKIEVRSYGLSGDKVEIFNFLCYLFLSLRNQHNCVPPYLCALYFDFFTAIVASGLLLIT